MPKTSPPPRTPSRMFETRSQAWRDAGLSRQVDRRAAKRARLEALLLVGLFVAVVVVYENRHSLFGVGTARGSSAALAAQIPVAAVLLILGWAIARDIGRALGPALFRRLDPAAAGTVGFLIRLATLALALLVALDVVGVEPGALFAGAAFTAVILGLAAQQTLGNLIAGTVLLSARPFRVGDRVRLQGGPLAGQIEGVVSSLGLMYTTFVAADDSIMVPNSVVLNVAVAVKEEHGHAERGASPAERGANERVAADEQPEADGADGAAEVGSAAAEPYRAPPPGRTR